jgi:hypothetical protein
MDLVKTGEQIKAAQVNEGIKANQQLRTIKVGSGLIAKNYPGGVFLDVAAQTATLPLAQYQGMVITMVSQNQYGWAFCQAVSMS